MATAVVILAAMLLLLLPAVFAVNATAALPASKYHLSVWPWNFDLVLSSTSFSFLQLVGIYIEWRPCVFSCIDGNDPAPLPTKTQQISI